MIDPDLRNTILSFFNDEWAIANNYISVVPVKYDLTAHHAITTLNEEWDI